MVRQMATQTATLESSRPASAEQRLKELGIKLPTPPQPFGIYVEAVQTGDLLFLTGMLPTEGRSAKFIGRVGAELDVEAGRKAAHLAALNVLAVARQYLGSLDKVTRIVRLGVSVATSEDVRDQPKVADAASELLQDVFGKDKSPCRLVYGVASLPLGAPVELEVIFEVAGKRSTVTRKGQSVIPILEINMSDVANTRQIRLARRAPSYWRVTFDHPPLNIFGPDTIPKLNEIVTALETDEDVKVVVFDSAVEGFFLTHYDFLAKIEHTTSLVPGPTGLSPLPDMLVRLSRAPVVSIASIRGRATGVGSELALASDMRFASRENAILSQWEVGAGLVPGSGPMARLPRLIGRGRALEVLLGADDIPGDLAELYGYVNRSLPDSDLDAFVDALAMRIASFDKQALAETKRLVDLNSLPPDAEIAPEWDAFIASLGRPAAQGRIKALMARGFHRPGDVESRLGHHVGQLGPE